MARKTFLFFPVDIGLAHIIRSLVIAEELHAQGHKVIFTLPKRKHAVLLGKTKVKIVDIYSPLKSDSIESLNIFRDKTELKKQVDEELLLLKKYSPDAVIVDYRISALAATAITGTKTYFLAHGTGLPYGARLPNPGIPKWFYKLSPQIIKGIVDFGEKWWR